MKQALGILKKPFERWDRFWFQPISAYPISAFRIVFGLYLFLYFLCSYVFHVDTSFSREGVYVPYPLEQVGDFAPSVVGAWIMYLGFLFFILLFSVGFYPRFITPLILILYTYHWSLNFAITNCSYDKINMIVLFILCFAELDRVWSVRKSANVVPRGEPTVRAWPTRLIALELSFMYFGAGLWKAVNPDWHLGRMMETTLVGPWATELARAFVFMNWPPWVYAVMTNGVYLFEISAAFGIWVYSVQKWYFLAGLAFHMFIWLFLDIPEFLCMPVMYILLMPPEKVRQWGESLRTMIRGPFTRTNRLNP